VAAGAETLVESEGCKQFASRGRWLGFVDKFARALPELVTALQRDAEAGDLGAVRIGAHTVKGMAMMIGAVAIADTLGKLQFCGDGGDTNGGKVVGEVQLLLVELKQREAAVLRECRTLLQEGEGEGDAALLPLLD
jgi:chemotaxis protein histidine kinase CheA